MAWYRGWAIYIYIYRLYRYGIGQAYTYHTSDIELLKQRYLQLKVYLCLAEIPDCLVILMSSWHISSLLQGVASGNQSTLSDVLFTKHTSSNKHQVIQHLATKSPANPLPTSSTVAEAASRAGTVFSCEFASEETATHEEMLSTSLKKISLVDFWNSIFRSQWSWFVQDVDIISIIRGAMRKSNLWNRQHERLPEVHVARLVLTLGCMMCKDTTNGRHVLHL